jgi:2,5-dihydroxypyridine 5,6-dioxygenase
MSRFCNSIKLFEEYFRLQNIKEGERVVIISGQYYDEKILRSYQAALLNLGSDFYTMLIPPKYKELELIKKPKLELIYDAIKEADVLLTLPGGMIIYGSEDGKKILESGVRCLYNSIDESALRRLWPTNEIIERTFNGVKIMEKSKILKITSNTGTDLIYDKTGTSGHCQCSLAHIKGRWDNSGYGKVDCGPPYKFAEGTLIIDKGDYIIPMDRIVENPIKCTIKDGYIVNIEGSSDAMLLKMWLEDFNDPESFRCSHIGWGTNDGAIYMGQGVTSTDRYNHYGSMAIAFGSNTLRTGAKYSGFDETFKAASHCDIVILNHNLWLDEIQILKEGRIIEPSCK